MQQISVIIDIFNYDCYDFSWAIPEGKMLVSATEGQTDPDLDWHEKVYDLVVGTPTEVCAAHNTTLNDNSPLRVSLSEVIR